MLLPNKAPIKYSIDILLAYIFTHFACLGVFYFDTSLRAIKIGVSCFFVRMLGLSVGYHRYFAHRAFKTSRAFQFLLALLGALSMQRGPLWWAQTHRHHHRHADTPEDLHSPHYQGFLYSHSGWFLDRKNRDTVSTKVPDLACFPELVFLDDWYSVIVVAYGFLVSLLWGVDGFLWGFCINGVLLWHMTHWIQSMSHTYGGYRNWSSKDQSRNHFLIGLLTLGEWHNNHHYASSSARQGIRWWELDAGYYVLCLLKYLGLVWDLKQPPPKMADPAVRNVE